MKDLVSILDGNTFLVSDRRGDIEPSYDFPTGLFSFDTRFLSTWVLTLDGERLHALSVDDAQSYRTRFFLAPGEPTHYVDAKVSVIRSRAIGGSFEEELTVLNHLGAEVEFTVRMEIGRRLRRPVRDQELSAEAGPDHRQGRRERAAAELPAGGLPPGDGGHAPPRRRRSTSTG